MKKNCVLKLIAAALLIATMMCVAAPALGASSGATLYKGDKVVTTGREYMRVSADPDASAITTVPEGHTFTLLADSRRDWRGVAWYKVKYNSYTGWISSKYTRQGGVTTLKLYTTGNANIRKGPSLYATVITSVPTHTRLEYQNAYAVDDRGVVWYKIKYSGKTGWVSSRYTDFM